MTDERQSQRVEIGIVAHECSLALVDFSEPHAIAGRRANRQFVRCLIVRRCCECDHDLRFIEAVLWNGRSNPANGAQIRQSIEKRLQIYPVDRLTAFRPCPFVVCTANESLLAVCRDTEAMNLFGLKLEDRQILPLQWVAMNFVEQFAPRRDDERLVAQTRINIVAIDFAERDRGDRLLTGFGLGLIEGLTKVFYPEASNTVIFVIMVIVLLIKPAGLFGKER